MNNEQGEQKISFFERNKFIIIFSGVFITLAILIVAVFFVINMLNNRRTSIINEEKQEIATTTEEIKEIGLPIGDEILEDIKNGNGNDDEWEAENISFGDFYKLETNDFEPKMNEYILPLNVKVAVANYHDVSRRINLDAGLDSLNQNGFAVISSPFSAEVDNFYSTYETLGNNQVPILITSDFLVYYYQNTLKNVFKDIEASVFYENLWDINKKLYKISKERYEKELALVGVTNSVYLEGARKELAFFATVLSILSPATYQIEGEADLSEKNGFSLAEANEFSFVLPDYLKNDVEREVALIKKAEKTEKSPVFLFEKDYKEFLVPKNYKTNARLNNFYQASKWLNSVFPLYYRNDNCPDCLLDKDDWRVSMCTAFLLAEDLSVNQDLQNKWAKIYKIMSFFEGLRGDLSYLYYEESFNEIFGKEKTVAEVFSSEKDELDLSLEKLQQKLFSFDFLEIEGSINKNNTSTMPYLGMKMLASSYWPNDYIFNELTYPKVDIFAKDKKDINNNIDNTTCLINRIPYRCFGFGFDVMSLIYDIDSESSPYVKENIDYSGYGEQLAGLKNQINNFNSYNWHSNSYWVTLDIFRNVLNASNDFKYIALRNEAYDKRNLNLALSSWVNIQLPADVLAPYSEDSFVGLGQVEGDKSFMNFSYIEPNLDLINELVANTNMVLEMLSLLEVNEYENIVLVNMANMKNNLEKTRAIIKKELTENQQTEADYKFINEFVKEFQVKEKGNKTLLFKSDYSKEVLVENLAGIKLLIFTYKKGNDNLFAVGPVFNYWEKRD